jgi:hypothetical protein
MDEDYKTVRSLRDFLQYNNGESGVVIEADTVLKISEEILDLIEVYEAKQRELGLL